jgi:DNA uptake protein ComE-like DNA-binding protein
VGSDIPRQPSAGRLHPKIMVSRAFFLFVALCCLGGCIACTNQNPDEIRQKTAERTAALKRETKAVAQGVKEGLSSKKSVDLNRAPKDEVASLPGITAGQADRIIAERPYANTHQLVTRQILSEEEYGKIQDRVVVNR